jgi:phosphoserine aminotransferase
MEISHRSKQFTAVIEKAEDNFRRLLNLPDHYHVLFLQGGASLQFSMVPINFLRGTGKAADYIMTGSWASKALTEAKKEGPVNIAWDGKEEGHVRMPGQDDLTLDADAAYVHMTSHETIQGTEFQAFPETGAVPLVCDASSDILSQPIPVEQFGIIFAGAQKNVGPAGTAVVIIRDDLLERVPDGLPSLLDYKNLAGKKSLYNTPPCFTIYMIQLVTDWLLDEVGGLDKMAEINRRKAKLLYDVIDANPEYYRGHAQPGSRSIMNVTFRLPNEELEQAFIKEATEKGMHGMKGHRSVGGCRASIYNAMPEAGVQALHDFMLEFMKANG